MVLFNVTTQFDFKHCLWENSGGTIITLRIPAGFCTSRFLKNVTGKAECSFPCSERKAVSLYMHKPTVKMKKQKQTEKTQPP